MEENPFNNFNTGADFWRETVQNNGIDNAFGICCRHLDVKLRSELSDGEKRLCRELFATMYEAEAGQIVPSKLVYPYDFKTANDRMETSYYHINRDKNQECAGAIDRAISASNNKLNHYNLELAAMLVISGYGFERVNAVLSHQIQKQEYDGRYSSANKKWAKEFTLLGEAFVFMRSHATLIDSFATYTRNLYTELDAKRFALRGKEEHGESEPVHGYEIIKSIMVDDKQGYVIAYNPNAVDPYVCWQFMVRDGERHCNWGLYGRYEYAADGYNARLFVAFN